MNIKEALINILFIFVTWVIVLVLGFIIILPSGTFTEKKPPTEYVPPKQDTIKRSGD